MTAPQKIGLREALALIAREIVGGCRHGFFDFSITGETARQGECSLTFKAGKSHRFRIPESDFKTDVTVSISDPEQKGAPLQLTHQNDQQNPDVMAGTSDHDETGRRSLEQTLRQKSERRGTAHD